MFHETVHSTGHSSRLNRHKFCFFGDDDYSKEELVAELGSAFLMNQVGIEQPSTFKNSVAYLQGWMSKLQSDPKLIVFAASQAEKADCGEQGYRRKLGGRRGISDGVKIWIYCHYL